MSRNSDREIDAGSKWPEIGRHLRLAFGPAYAPARGKGRMICRRPWSRTSSESSGDVSRKLTSTTKSRPVSNGHPYCRFPKNEGLEPWERYFVGRNRYRRESLPPRSRRHGYRATSVMQFRVTGSSGIRNVTVSDSATPTQTVP